MASHMNHEEGFLSRRNLGETKYIHFPRFLLLAQGFVVLDCQIWVELVDVVARVLDSWSFSRCKSS
jgi:hypothetical protein